MSPRCRSGSRRCTSAAPGRPEAARRATAALAGLPNDALTAELAAWRAGSPRFRAFVEANGGKIHKKLREATDPDARRDVRTELLVARLLVADRRVSLAFEAYGAAGGPDFTVTYGGERPFNVEVTRTRREGEALDIGLPILTKLRQLPPSLPNLLVVAVSGGAPLDVDVEAGVRALRSRADRKEEAFFVGRGFASSRAFYERFLRLGGVVAWREALTDGEGASLWVNRSARIPLPQRAARAVTALLAAG